MHGLELAARIFMSCAGDGRSMHYHEMALNTLTFGRKRWAVLPPHHAHFSTQMGSVLFAELDTGAKFHPPPVVDQSDTTVNEFAKVEAEIRSLQPLQCIQEAGDIVLVPALWSHATLSLEACYAFATFLDFEPVFSPLDEVGIGRAPLVLHWLSQYAFKRARANCFALLLRCCDCSGSICETWCRGKRIRTSLIPHAAACYRYGQYMSYAHYIPVAFKYYIRALNAAILNVCMLCMYMFRVSKGTSASARATCSLHHLTPRELCV